MSFFPYHSYSLHSTQNADEVKQTIRTWIEPVKFPRNLYARDQYLPFEGVMKVDTFRIQCIHGFRRPFFPYTYGKLSATANGTTLKITTRLNGFVYFILLLWLAFFSLFTLPFLFDGYYRSAGVTGVITVTVIAMLLFQFHKDDTETRAYMQKAMGIL